MRKRHNAPPDQEPVEIGRITLHLMANGDVRVAGLHPDWRITMTALQRAQMAVMDHHLNQGEPSRVVVPKPRIVTPA